MLPYTFTILIWVWGTVGMTVYVETHDFELRLQCEQVRIRMVAAMRVSGYGKWAISRCKRKVVV